MRVPLSWLGEFVPLDGLTPAQIDAAMVRMGLEVEAVEDLTASVDGPLVVGRILEIEELTGLKKPIRFVQVEVGASEPSGIICGARNFAVGDLVPVALPGAVLPGGFEIGARKTYGRMSAGMICSAAELGLGDDHDGIMVLPAGTPGEDARSLVGLDDVIIELAITPNMAHCLSIRGVAREVSIALDRPFNDPVGLPAGPNAQPANAPTRRRTAEPAWQVEIEDAGGCDRFATALVRDVNVSAQSPAWLKTRLTRAGMRPISLAVDITNYVMLELGQPMHAFDADRMRGLLRVRRAVTGERLTTLDGTDRKLDPADLIIADDSGVISLAAVMGGASTEINDATRTVLFEAAHWDEVTVARTARRHKLPSEAVKRFERGVDADLPLVALERAVTLLAEHGGGVVDERVGDVNNVRPWQAIKFDPALASRITGVDYSLAEVTDALEAVGCTIEDPWVAAPAWRRDLSEPIDLVEEVVRVRGYDQVGSVLPSAPAGRGLTAGQRRRRSVSRALAEAGYVETLSYPFVAPETRETLGLPGDRVVRLANPMSEREPELRTSLLPTLLGTLRRNAGRGFRDLSLYELGMVFQTSLDSSVPPELGVTQRPSDAELAAAQATLPVQVWHAATVLTSEDGIEQWAEAIESARLIAVRAGVSLSVARASAMPWHPGRCAVLSVDGVVVGHAGELHPTVCTALELPPRTAAMELDLDALPLGAAPAGPQISSYPPALIDVALAVDATTPAAQVESALVDGAGELLESIRLFDVFTGAQVGEGRKSLAYKLIFRAPDRTLTVEEAVTQRDAAVALASERLGAELRA